ncbi:MAG: sporulation protein YqfD [Clostridia bacterium]|nr:sporulation protein YqfD [Clostridia bacterium]
MIFRLFCLLIGYAKITLGGRAEAAATLFLREKINVAAQKKGDGGRLSFVVPLYEKRKLLRLLAVYGFTVESVEYGGLPPCLWQFRRRVGLLLGLSAAAAITVSGSLFLWQIRVVGCETVSEDEVLTLLADEGVEVGSYIPPIDAIVTAQKVLLKDDRIAFIAVNIIGTRCEVQVTEAAFPNAAPKDDRPSSLTARFGGLIERIEMYDGQVMIKPGEAVLPGQVLISGLCEMEEGRWRLTAASGKVYAKVERTFTVEVPLAEEILRPTGESAVKKSLIFFKKSVKLFESSSILTPTYGTIISKDTLTLPDGTPLPIAIATERTVGLEKVTLTRTAAEAESVASERIASLVAKELREAEILSLTRSVEHTDKGVTLTWQVYCIMDIAESVPMTGLPDSTQSHTNTNIFPKSFWSSKNLSLSKKSS